MSQTTPLPMGHGAGLSEDRLRVHQTHRCRVGLFMGYCLVPVRCLRKKASTVARRDSPKTLKTMGHKGATRDWEL